MRPCLDHLNKVGSNAATPKESSMMPDMNMSTGEQNAQHFIVGVDSTDSDTPTAPVEEQPQAVRVRFAREIESSAAKRRETLDGRRRRLEAADPWLPLVLDERGRDQWTLPPASSDDSKPAPSAVFDTVSLQQVLRALCPVAVEQRA
jgi:hypothetical protein